MIVVILLCEQCLILIGKKKKKITDQIAQVLNPNLNKIMQNYHKQLFCTWNTKTQNTK